MSKLSKPKEIKLPKTAKVANKITLEFDQGTIIEQKDEETLGASGDLDGKHHHIAHSIQKYTKLLNANDFGGLFQCGHTTYGQIEGIRRVERTTVETINPDGFNPYEKKKDETFFRYYVIDIADSLDQYKYTDDDFKKKVFLENMGFIYLKSESIDFIYDFVRKNK